MAFESDFNDLMPDTVVRNAYASIDGYGKPTYSTAGSTYTARVTYKQKRIVGADGTERVSVANLLVATTAALGVNDKYTLADGTIGPVLAIERVSDTGGQHHARVFF